MNATRMSSGSDDPWKPRLAIAVVAFCGAVVGALIAESLTTGMHWWTGLVLAVCGYVQGWFTREVTLPRTTDAQRGT
jgi:uncharacterized membrane protein YfcA